MMPKDKARINILLLHIASAVEVTPPLTHIAKATAAEKRYGVQVSDTTEAAQRNYSWSQKNSMVSAA